MSDLVIAEIEFATEDEMKAFENPSKEWTEVSNKEEYTGGYLAAQLAVSRKEAQ